MTFSEEGGSEKAYIQLSKRRFSTPPRRRYSIYIPTQNGFGQKQLQRLSYLCPDLPYQRSTLWMLPSPIPKGSALPPLLGCCLAVRHSRCQTTSECGLPLERPYAALPELHKLRRSSCLSCSTDPSLLA